MFSKYKNFIVFLRSKIQPYLKYLYDKILISFINHTFNIPSYDVTNEGNPLPMTYFFNYFGTMLYDKRSKWKQEMKSLYFKSIYLRLFSLILTQPIKKEKSL